MAERRRARPGRSRGCSGPARGRSSPRGTCCRRGRSRSPRRCRGSLRRARRRAAPARSRCPRPPRSSPGRSRPSRADATPMRPTPCAASRLMHSSRPRLSMWSCDAGAGPSASGIGREGCRTRNGPTASRAGGSAAGGSRPRPPSARRCRASPGAARRPRRRPHRWRSRPGVASRRARGSALRAPAPTRARAGGGRSGGPRAGSRARACRGRRASARRRSRCPRTAPSSAWISVAVCSRGLADHHPAQHAHHGAGSAFDEDETAHLLGEVTSPVGRNWAGLGELTRAHASVFAERARRS